MWSLHWLGLRKPPLNEVCAGGGWHRSAASGGLDEFKSSYDRQFHVANDRGQTAEVISVAGDSVDDSAVERFLVLLFFFCMHCRSKISHGYAFPLVQFLP